MGPEVADSTFAVPVVASGTVVELQNLVPVLNCGKPALVNPVLEQNGHAVLGPFQVFARNLQSFPNRNCLHTKYPLDLFVFRTD